MYIRSTNCEQFTEQDICNACLELKNNNRFWNSLTRLTPKPKNQKFVLKYYLKTNPLFNHLQYTNVQELHYLLIDTSEQLRSDSAFWQTFANKASQGAFNKKPVFKGLCQIMLQVANASEVNKGK